MQNLIDDGLVTLDDAEIRAGELVISEQSGVEQSRKIKEMNIHPDYNTETTGQANDICLLYLESKLEINDQVKTISLNTDETATGTECIVSGWGVFVSI